MMHEIKLRKEFELEVLSGRKSFEIRYNDRDYKKEDKIIFTVIDKDGNEVAESPLHSKVYKITYILSGWGLHEGYVAFAIKELKNEIFIRLRKDSVKE